MPEVYEIQLHKIMGGIGARGQFANTYHVQFDNAVDSPSMLAVMEYIHDAERAVSVSEVHFMRAHAKRLAAPKSEDPFVSYFDTHGLRQVSFIGVAVDGPQIVNPMLPIDSVLTIKREALRGRAGMLSYRGVLLTSDVKTGLNGTFVLNDPTLGFSNAGGTYPLVTALNGMLPGAKFVLPRKNGAVSDIVRHRIQGVRHLSLTHSYTTVSQEEKHAAQRALNDLARRAKHLIGDVLDASAAPVQAAAKGASVLAAWTILRNEAVGIMSGLPAAERVAITAGESLGEILALAAAI
jgi:hypothetical protein